MNISVDVCRRCKRLFNYPGYGLKFCPTCMKEDDANREKVKAFLRENGAANMYEISEATGVSERTIKAYLREGMLEIPDGSPIYIKCEKCGCDIRSGRWCAECAARLSADLKGSFAVVGEKPKFKMEGKMRFKKRS